MLQPRTHTKRGEKERNFFSTELLGVSFKNAQNALISGSEQELNDLLEKAAEKNGKALELQNELETLFNNQNQSSNSTTTSIKATFLRVTVLV